MIFLIILLLQIFSPLRGTCKIAVPQKIDDFAACSQGQSAGPCCADETILEQVGEEAQWEEASKGRFYGVHDFCKCLISAQEKPIVIFLNGTSSAGKTSIAKQIQIQSEKPFLYAGIDLFINMLPPCYLPDGDKADLGFHVFLENGPKRIVELGPDAKRFIHAMHRSMKVMLDHNFNLILDEVLVSEEEYRDYLELFKDVKLLFVGVKTPLHVAEQRERERGDRLEGYARGFYDRVHLGKEYDLEIDSSQIDPEQSAKIILEHLYRS